MKQNILAIPANNSNNANLSSVARRNQCAETKK